MPNYRYRLIDVEYVLTEDEHKYCIAQFKRGTNIVSLRGDTLLINMAMLKSANTTDHPIDEPRGRQLRLDQPVAPRLRAPVVDPITAAQRHCEFYTRMNWDHRDGCWCKTQKPQ